MYNEEKVEIKVTEGKDRDYLIKDKYGISLGRIFIIELSKENKFCCFRIKFYKKGDSHSKELKKALDVMITSLFKNMDLLKVSVIADQDTMLNPFTELGFTLEGILSNSSIVNNEHRSELIFGVDISTFKQDRNINVLRLKGEKIELKVLTPEDSRDILDYYIRNKEYLKPFEPIREENFYTLEVQTQNLIESYKQFLNGTSTEFGIYKNKQFVGKIRLSNVVRGIFQNAFVGYSMDEKEQNKGYMKEALKLVLEYAFDDMELHRIEATTLLDNEKSQRVLKSCGFKEAGISEKYLFINGKWRDHKIFYMTKE
ncbi:GNAT family N-acetyltransferase [Clostridium ganghwense]|uniref:GNAT family protein n=1 Tax=Clostridium ganghwense TaxID=312089 RepID=A0ABT4CXM4_9CLOT|nr:GNAT family protein [Clostridium ganghwense]MCY6372781.1 GNAT family protein [Clostridium ganghwense]